VIRCGNDQPELRGCRLGRGEKGRRRHVLRERARGEELWFSMRKLISWSSIYGDAAWEKGRNRGILEERLTLNRRCKPVE
jgi:hypothetical protein